MITAVGLLTVLSLALLVSGQDLERTFGVRYQRFSVGAAGSGITPKIAVDDTYVYVVARDESNEGRLTITRCDQSDVGNTCVSEDVSTQVNLLADSVRGPDILLDTAQSVLYVAASIPHLANTAGVFRCPIPSLTGCTFERIEQGLAGIAEVTIARNPDVPKIFVAGRSINTNNRPVFYACDLDLSNCIEDTPSYVHADENGYHPFIVPFNKTGALNPQPELMVFGCMRTSTEFGTQNFGYSYEDYSYIPYNVRNGVATRLSHTDVTLLPGGRDAILVATAEGEGGHVILSNCDSSYDRTTPSFTSPGCATAYTVYETSKVPMHEDDGIMPILTRDGPGNNIYISVLDRGGGNRAKLFVSGYQPNADYGNEFFASQVVDLAQAVGLGNNTAYAVHSAWNPVSRNLFVVTQNGDAGANSTDIIVAGRFPVVIPFFGSCIKNCTLGLGGGNTTLSAQDYVVEFNDLYIDGVLASETNVTVSFNYTTAEVSPFASRRRKLLDVSLTLIELSFPSLPNYGFPDIVSVYKATGETQSLTGLIYVDPAVDAGCATPGTWFSDGVCRPCPIGGECPGGSRVWPVSGYWSLSEFTAPVACENDACCGAIGQVRSCPIVELSSGSRNTQRCDPDSGRAGTLCADCAPGYYKDAGVCRPCDSQDAGSFAVLVVVAVVFVLVLAAATAVLPMGAMAKTASALVALQQFVAAGRTGATQLTGPSGNAVADVFRVASVINFDFEMVAPACYVSSSITFVDIFYAALIIVGVSGLILILASVIYAAVGYKLAARLFSGAHAHSHASSDEWGKDWVATDSDIVLSSSALVDEYEEEQERHHGKGDWGDDDQEEEEDGEEDESDEYDEDKEDTEGGDEEDEGEYESTLSATFWGRLAQRASSAVMLLAVLVYFQVALRASQTVACKRETTSGDAKLRLRIELITVCYEGAHTEAASLAWTVLGAFVAVFPIALFVLLSVARVCNRESRLLTAGPLWFLVRGLKGHFYFFRLFSLILSLVIAANTASGSSASVKLFVLGLSFILNVVVVGAFLPFTGMRNNLIQLAVGIAAGVQMIVFLAVADDVNSDYLYALVALLSASLVFVVILRTIHYFLHPCGGGDDDDGDDDDEDDDYTLLTDDYLTSSEEP